MEKDSITNVIVTLSFLVVMFSGIYFCVMNAIRGGSIEYLFLENAEYVYQNARVWPHDPFSQDEIRAFQGEVTAKLDDLFAVHRHAKETVDRNTNYFESAERKLVELRRSPPPKSIKGGKKYLEDIASAESKIRDAEILLRDAYAALRYATREYNMALNVAKKLGFSTEQHELNIRKNASAPTQ